MKTHFIEFLKDMFKIPLLTMSTKAFPDHGWRFGIPKAFYITIEGTDFIDKLGKNSLIYSYNYTFYITIGKKSLICIQNYYQMFGQIEESIVKHIVLLK